MVFDYLRQKYVVLTPEENVRQHFVHWLVDDLGFPKSMMNNEITLNINGLTRRCDTLVFDKEAKPWMVIEYKAPSIKISQSVFDQIVRYNMVLSAPYMVVSNGINHYCCKVDYANNTYNFLPDIPHYNEIRQSI